MINLRQRNKGKVAVEHKQKPAKVPSTNLSLDLIGDVDKQKSFASIVKL